MMKLSSYKRWIVLIVIFPLNIQADNTLTEKLSESSFSSYHEFALHACLPCHYSSENSTNLIQPIERMNEDELQLYLDVMLHYGNMPPDPIFREILIGKLGFMGKR